MKIKVILNTFHVFIIGFLPFDTSRSDFNELFNEV